MLYKPTFPSPYAECIALSNTDNDLFFSCNMIGDSGIESTRLKISDEDTQYYFTNVSSVSYVRRQKSRMYINGDKYILGGAAYDGLTYVYPVYTGMKYSISCQNNSIFKVGYYENSQAQGTGNPIDIIDTEDSLHECDYTAEVDGFIYISVSTTDKSSINDKIIVVVNEYVEDTNVVISNIVRRDSITNIDVLLNEEKKYSGNTINSADSSKDFFANKSLIDILKPNNDYTWQVRLYEKGSLKDDDNTNYRSNIWLGYGVVEKITSSSSYVNDNNYFYVSDAYKDIVKSNATGICFKIRPHTNIYGENATGGVSSITKSVSGKTETFNLQPFYNYYDDNARYYIKVNGDYHRIKDYRFYPPASDEMLSGHINNYGEPLYGYAVIDYTLDSDIDEPILKAGDQYEIYCNYIDSDEFYFNVVDTPQLTFLDINEVEISKDETFPTEINYSNLTLNGLYNHTGGANIEKYNVMLYKNISTDAENKVWELIEETKDIHDSQITYNYDLLLSGNEYKIEINAIDSLRYRIKEKLYLNVKYDVFDRGKSVDVRYYQKHDSIIIDWSEGDSVDCDHFVVYKKIGNNPKLHKVCETQDWSQQIVEDFAVGNLCNYTYFVYPITTSTKQNGNTYCRIEDQFQSSPVSFNYGATTILGLIQDEEDLNTYTIDYNDMWRFEFNMENTGSTLNMDKTFVDSQNRFPKLLGGNRRYNTIPIKGLIGYYDCEKDDYVENYDLLEDWESFATNNRLKLLKDRRGRLVPCDVESSSYEYMDALEAPVTVSFSAKQLESLDNITILGRALIHNPVKSSILTTSDGEVLTDSATNALLSQES